MDKNDFWFLDSVLSSSYPVYWLGAPADNLEMLFNRHHHELSGHEVARMLDRLSQHGDLAVFVYDAETIDSSPQPISLSVAELEAAVQTDQQLGYALTTQGGARWERLARPDWSRFLRVDQRGDDQLTTTIMTTRRAWIEEYLAIYQYHHKDEAIIPGTIQWSVESPWEALYWKTLDCGHRMQFQVRGKEMEQDPQWHAQAWAALQQWYIKSRWYTDPWSP